MIHESWGKELFELAKEKRKELIKSGKHFLPEADNIFKALEIPFDKVKVLIIGQDPYPNKEDACGLAFSSPSRIPATLKNIFSTINDETKSGDLTPWVNQGVLLLNRALTLTIDKNVDSKKLLNKNIKIWKDVINKIIEKLLDAEKPLVVMLWGNSANGLIPTEPKDKKNIHILRASHPSSRSFYRKLKKYDCDSFSECRHFEKCNEFLGVDKIDWRT